MAAAVIMRQQDAIDEVLVPIGINNMTYYIAFFSALDSISACCKASIMPRNSPYSIALTSSEKAALEDIAREYTSPYYQVVRAKAILMAARGLRNDEIAARVSLPRQIISKWRKRFFEERLEGLERSEEHTSE